MQLEIEEAALKKESDDASKKRLKNLQEELAELREEANAMKMQWETEKEVRWHRVHFYPNRCTGFIDQIDCFVW